MLIRSLRLNPNTHNNLNDIQDIQEHQDIESQILKDFGSVRRGHPIPSHQHHSPTQPLPTPQLHIPLAVADNHDHLSCTPDVHISEHTVDSSQDDSQDDSSPMQGQEDVEDFSPDYTEVVEQNQSDSLGTT